MKTRKVAKNQSLSAEEIDGLVTAQAEDETAWEEPVQVRRAKKLGSLSIPADLAARAAFLARVHHARDVEEWLTKVIKERIEIEEGAYAAVKRELSSTPTRRTPA